ncbi:MAG: flagellar basal body L-ring protein FlgH [Piscinibacter sp.]
MTVLRLLCLAPATLAAACASAPPSTISVPLSAAPLPPPQQVERIATGSLFQPNAPITSLFSGERRPRNIGDTLKIDIAENLSGSIKQNSDTSRENKVASKGPGTSSSSVNGALKSLLNLDASASGSDSFKGAGEAASNSSFNGRIATTVINVLPNGNLVVAGERSIAMSNGSTVLRFSGIVNPSDIKAGNVVASADVVDARLESVGSGDTADSTRRGWLQRALTNSLRVW